MKNLLTLIVILFCTITLWAQAPQSFRYQAVARDNSGFVLSNRPVSFKISILSGTVSGTTVYSETHAGITTNAFGLVDLEIGKGTPVTGTFASINWGGSLHFAKIEMDPSGGSAYQLLGTSQLLSVPYALNARTAQLVPDQSVTGAKIAPMDAMAGQALKWNGTTWAPAEDNSSVWQLSGNKIYYNNGNVGVGTDNPQSMMHLNNEFTYSGLIMSNEASGKTFDDGFHIGLQYQGDVPSNRYAIILNRENTKLVIGTNNNNAGDLTILPGGNIGLGTNTPTTRLDVDGQIRIRQGSPGAGKVLTSDGVGLASWQPLDITLPYYQKCATNVGFVIHNETGIAIEGLAASDTNEGSGTGVMGESRKTGGTGIYGLASYTGTGTTYALRAESKSSNGFGLKADATHTSGSNFGVWASSSSSQGIAVYGTNNSATGITYGIRGDINSAQGYSGYFRGGKFYVSGRAGFGTENPLAGLHLKGTGYPESFIYLESNSGQDAGFRLYEGTTEKWHIFNNSVAGGLTINNNAYDIALFAKQSNAYVGLGTSAPTQKLHVVGNAYKTEGGTAWATSSDLRLKTVLGTYEKGLDEIAALEPVRFVYHENNPRQLSCDIEQVGFVAQEVRKIFPEAVSEGEDGYLDFNIHPVNVALVNAVRELKAEIDRLTQENQVLRTENAGLSENAGKLSSDMASLDARLKRLETLLGEKASR